jgi:hypothetical protein
VDRALLQPAPAAHDAWEREPDQLRIGLANAEAEDIINLSTESRQAQRPPLRVSLGEGLGISAFPGFEIRLPALVSK